MKDKKKIILTIVAVLAFIAVVVGATYAYFVANVGSGSGSNINAATGTTDSLSFNTGSRINIYATTENFGQGLGNQADSTTASATLVANNGNNYAKYTYYMYLDISKNELKYTTLDKTAELILTITDKEGTPITSIEGLDYVTVGDVSGFDITESEGIIKILNQHEIETTSTEVHEWNITVTLINLDSNQSENLNKTFLADVLIQKDEYTGNSAVLKRPSEGGYGIPAWYIGRIDKIVFEDSAIEHTDAINVYDFSEAQDESIKAYKVNADNEYTLYINSNKKIIANEDMSYWFTAFYDYFSEVGGPSVSLRTIEGLENVDFSNTTNMSWMFGNCYGLTSLDLSMLDTSNVTNMSFMFNYCDRLKTIDFSSFNTGNVTNMYSMFRGCRGLTELDLSSFDTSNVTDMSSMFDMYMGSDYTDCDTLAILDLSSFNTSNVTTMESMFRGCSGLTNLDLSPLDTSNVTLMDSMFRGCSGLTSLDLSPLDTSKVTRMDSMFRGCSGLTTLDLSTLDTSNVTGMSYMFYGCSGLTALDMLNTDFTKVKSYSFMFRSVPSNINIIVKDADAENFIKTKAGDWPSTGTVTIAS